MISCGNNLIAFAANFAEVCNKVQLNDKSFNCHYSLNV